VFTFVLDVSGLTSVIVITNAHLIIPELFAPFSDMLPSHCAVTIHLYELVVKVVTGNRFHA
jgi:hypothetical protein